MKTFKWIPVLFLISVSFLACKKEDAYEITIPKLNEEVYPAKKLDSILQNYHYCNMQDIYAPAGKISVLFNEQFPNARDIEWEEGCGFYKVDFEIKKLDYQALYDTAGNLLLYKHDIPSRTLPKTVKNAIDSKYNKYRIEDVDKVFMAKYVCYEVDLDNKNYRDLEICVKEDGAIVYERLD